MYVYNGPFKELFGMTFANAQTKMPELSLQEKKNTISIKKRAKGKVEE